MKRVQLLSAALVTTVALVGIAAVDLPSGRAGGGRGAPGEENEREEQVKGPDQERWYFEKWHQRYGPELPAEVMQETWNEIHALPSEPETRSVNSWTTLGPFGMRVPASNATYYSGRILDLDEYYVASASGGLWQPFLNFRFPLSDVVTSLAIGSFASQPGSNGSTILLGTGEPYQRSGTGLWMTADGGGTWTNLHLNPNPTAFYKIRYTPDNPLIAHAAANTGYYRSTNGGLSWTRTLAGNCSDVAPSIDLLGIVYAALWGDGLYKSTDAGLHWSKLTSGGIPTSNVGRTAIHLAINPSYVWVSMARNDNNSALGVFRSIDSGTTWANISPPGDYLWGQGWYDNIIAASPNNANLVIVGGGNLWRTSDGGAHWTEINYDADVHVDQHAIKWLDAANVEVGNDGGLCSSSDGGVNWESFGNSYPITQYVNFDVGVSNPGVIFGGSQDNGFSGTTDAGGHWNQTFGGDGGGLSIDPGDASRIWGTLGVYGGNWTFRRHRSTDTGQTWNNGINNGIDPSGQWYTKIRNDRVSPVYLYTNSGFYVYRSTDYGSNWTAYNPAFPAWLYNLNISQYSEGYSVIYASLSPDSPFAGRQLRVFDNGSWYERSSGFPTDVWVRGVAVHPSDPNKAYALMTGFDAGQKVFKTTNRGVTWTNISGNLPNVPMGDLVPHPTNDAILYLGTEFGCYRTTNGGAGWHRWNNGMPEADIVTEMGAIDRRGLDGTYYVLACTYGRSIWSREISGDDPTAVPAVAQAAPPEVELGNAPNPFRGSTTIRFRLPAKGSAELQVYDAAGRVVARPFSGPAEAGLHTVAFDRGRLAAGVYFYRLKVEGTDRTEKMIILP